MYRILTVICVLFCGHIALCPISCTLQYYGKTKRAGPLGAKLLRYKHLDVLT
jgi:hypothetical protein